MFLIFLVLMITSANCCSESFRQKNRLYIDGASLLSSGLDPVLLHMTYNDKHWCNTVNINGSVNRLTNCTYYASNIAIRDDPKLWVDYRSHSEQGIIINRNGTLVPVKYYPLSIRVIINKKDTSLLTIHNIKSRIKETLQNNVYKNISSSAIKELFDILKESGYEDDHLVTEYINPIIGNTLRLKFIVPIEIMSQFTIKNTVYVNFVSEYTKPRMIAIVFVGEKYTIYDVIRRGNAQNDLRWINPHVYSDFNALKMIYTRQWHLYKYSINVKNDTYIMTLNHVWDISSGKFTTFTDSYLNGSSQNKSIYLDLKCYECEGYPYASFDTTFQTTVIDESEFAMNPVIFGFISVSMVLWIVVIYLWRNIKNS